MKKSRSKKIDYQIKIDQNFIFDNKVKRTTDINILLNRVRQKNKSDFKKRLIFSIYHSKNFGELKTLKLQ